MRQRSGLRYLQLGIEGVIALSLFTIIYIEYIRPWLVRTIYEDQYKQLALECDVAMHNEVILRSDEKNTSKGALLDLSAQVELTVCHSYDKLRKRLLILGVEETRLSLWGLETLESERIPISRLVTPHQMDHF